MKFGKDGDGNCGYYGADGSLIPFKSNIEYITTINGNIYNNKQYAGIASYTVKKSGKYLFICFMEEGKAKNNFSVTINDANLTDFTDFYEPCHSGTYHNRCIQFQIDCQINDIIKVIDKDQICYGLVLMVYSL